VLGHSIRDPPPLSYHLSFIVGLAERGLPTWYLSQKVSSSSPGHAYSAVRYYSRLHKSIQWGSCSTNQWRWSPGWHVVGGMLEPDKRPSHLFYITWVLYSDLQMWAFQLGTRAEVLGSTPPDHTLIPLRVIIPTYLVVSWVCSRGSRLAEGKCWTIA
jgi:hypothetical protein